MKNSSLLLTILAFLGNIFNGSGQGHPPRAPADRDD